MNLVLFFAVIKIAVFAKNEDDYNYEELSEDQKDNFENSQDKKDTRVNQFLANISLSNDIVSKILSKQILNYEDKKSV